MTPGRILLLFIATIAGGIGWVAFDDRFGRPDRPSPVIDHVPVLAPPPDSGLPGPNGFTLCDGSIRADCVVDGDTFWFRGEKIRIAYIDASEISQPACAAERQAGEMSPDRILTMLNEGWFKLSSGWRDEDHYGRKLRVVSRSGESLGERLVEEGLARRSDGPDFGWCDDDRPEIGARR